MLQLFILCLTTFLSGYVAQGCQNDAECEALHVHAYCSGGGCQIVPCDNNTCILARPYVKPLCCNAHPEGQKTQYCDCSIPVRKHCFFPDCDLGLCVQRDCNAVRECVVDTETCICVLGRCTPRVNCLEDPECDASTDKLCVQGVCRIISCPYNDDRCRIPPDLVGGCYNTTCNARGHCVGITCPLGAGGGGDDGFDDFTDFNGADGVGLVIELEMIEPDVVGSIVASLFIIFILLLAVALCLYLAYTKKRK